MPNPAVKTEAQHEQDCPYFVQVSCQGGLPLVLQYRTNVGNECVIMRQSSAFRMCGSILFIITFHNQERKSVGVGPSFIWIFILLGRRRIEQI